tara:strand:+ start:410 stop:757 length:348 start_codon:yes stop_codon:yes gene_type:complete
MTAKKAIIVLRISKGVKAKDIQKTAHQLNESCKEADFEVIQTYEYLAGNHRMRKEFIKHVKDCPERIAVIVNDLCFEENEHQKSDCVLNALTRQGVISVYKRSPDGKLYINRGVV